MGAALSIFQSLLMQLHDRQSVLSLNDPSIILDLSGVVLTPSINQYICFLYLQTHQFSRVEIFAGHRKEDSVLLLRKPVLSLLPAAFFALFPLPPSLCLLPSAPSPSALQTVSTVKQSRDERGRKHWRRGLAPLRNCQNSRWREGLFFVCFFSCCASGVFLSLFQC